MSEIAFGLIKHTVLVVVGKAERAIPIQAILQKAGYRVVVSTAALDAVKSVSNEMPHLIVTESILPDGNAGLVFDRISADILFKNIPILVVMYKKSKEELGALVKRGFAGFWLGKIEAEAFSQKIKEILAGKGGNLSPYFLTPKMAGIGENLDVALEASAVGKRGSYVIFRSKTILDGRASVLCRPTDRKKESVWLRTAHNIVNGDEVFNLFPFCRMTGSGRSWLAKLPKITLGESGEDVRAVKKIIFFDNNTERFKNFKALLHGYGFDLSHANSSTTLIAALGKRPEEAGAVFFNDIPKDFPLLVKNVIEPIPRNQRPALVVASSDGGIFRSSPSLAYLPKPFGLGVLLETLDAVVERGQTLAKAVTSTGGLGVEFGAEARLVGLDEIGGVFELAFPAVVGSKALLRHPDLEQLWGQQVLATITACAPNSNGQDSWFARFESVAAGTSKSKYWERVVKLFAGATRKAAS